MALFLISLSVAIVAIPVMTSSSAIVAAIISRFFSLPLKRDFFSLSAAGGSVILALPAMSAFSPCRLLSPLC